MSTGFREDLAWQERFRDHYAEIAVGVVRVKVAAWEDDAKRNTDMQIATLDGGQRIACRARRSGYAARFHGDFTIRLSRPTGAPTEMEKLRDGLGDYGIYGFESETGSGRLHPWVLLNLAILRQYLDGGGRWTRGRNDDDTEFAAFTLEDLPVGCIIQSEGHTFADNPFDPNVALCPYCQRPTWIAKAHPCCEGSRHRPSGQRCPCLEGLGRYHYGWPT